MKKLGGIEKIEDFILAIAGGADINGTWKGVPLVDYYFQQLMHIYEISNKTHRTLLQKYKILVAAGADVSSVIRGYPGSYDNAFHLMWRTTLRLELLSALLESAQAQNLLWQNNYYHSAVLELRDALRKTLAQIEQAEDAL